jgi:hypothetical protein
MREYLMNAEEFQIQVKKASESIEQSYWKTIKRIERLKKKINDLERSIGQKETGQTFDHMKPLDRAKHRLDMISDSLILESKEAWVRYKTLENVSKEIKLENADLRRLRFSCEKIEGLAADLLCYSLAHFRKQNK